MKKNLAVTIIALNEEANITDCLNSVKDIADEIIVVLDPRSIDKTEELARQQGAKVYVRAFDNFANQKNFASSKVNSKWVLTLDADERITKPLQDEIKEAIKNDSYSGFLMPRRNFILGAEIKHSRWSPDTHIWLWQKNKGKWQGDVHEEVVVSGPLGKLKNAKIHYQDKTISEFIKTNHRYAALKARQMIKDGVKFSFFKMISDAFWEFGVRFIYKQGYLDGWRGLVLSLAMGFYWLDVWMNILKNK